MDKFSKQNNPLDPDQRQEAEQEETENNIKTIQLEKQFRRINIFFIFFRIFFIVAGIGFIAYSCYAAYNRLWDSSYATMFWSKTVSHAINVFLSGCAGIICLNIGISFFIKHGKLIMPITSIVWGVISFFSTGFKIFALILAIMGLLFGISSLVMKKSGRAIPIIGLCISCAALIFVVSLLI